MLRPLSRMCCALLIGCAATTAVSAAPNRGFFADYQDIESAEFRQWDREFRRERALENLAAELNGIVRVPEPIALSLEECGESNAYYDPEARRISLCYEMAAELVELFADERPSDEVDALVSGTMMFFLGHEVAHALTHVLDLPITGREEDAADQLAVLLLSDGSDDSETALIGAAEAFARWSADIDDADEETFADEHALDLQRLYNILCWSYGRDPDAYADFVNDGLLPESRAEGCADEFTRIETAWNRLLEGHIVDTTTSRPEPPSRQQRQPRQETLGHSRD